MEPQNTEAKSKSSTQLKGERKQITVAFSDLSGYTAMSNKLDPEDVKEVMNNIFRRAEEIISKYGGTVDKYIGDAVMYLFGYPNAHEDDPVRAIKAALEIHEAVKEMSPGVAARIGEPLAMHSGIDTGTVLTDVSEFDQNKEGMLGNSINLASRLTSLAGAGEILVGQGTQKLASRYFEFDEMEPAKIKGFDDDIISYKLASAKEDPATVHRLAGLRAGLIGRDAELSTLVDAAKRLESGEGSVISVIGDAGTGKSRLVGEFKNSLDLDRFQWREGRALSFSQNTSYFMLVDLLNRAWQIKEDDPRSVVKEKLENNLEQLLGSTDLAPFLGGLYALGYEETKGINPEFWKTKLLESIKEVLGALTSRTPAIIYLEDLHWADPSSIETLISILTTENYPAIFLFTYRPDFSFPSRAQLESLVQPHEEVWLKDLSSDNAQDMVASLLDSKTVPTELSKFLKSRAEGNPFYIEEVINSLIETDTLVKDKGIWKLTKTLEEVKVPTTINGVISSRLDRLEDSMKRVIKEASVIGRAFLFEILNKISDLREKLEEELDGLENLNLIRARQQKPDLEYIFKHALTQDVAYSRLLKTERKVLHEKIANVIEEIFRDRLEEFYEVLAFHYQQSQAEDKAIEYLVKSGAKNLKKYSLDESHQFYKRAFQILENRRDKTEEEQELTIDILIDWALVFFYRGDFTTLTDILKSQEKAASILRDRERLAMLYFWLAISSHMGRIDFKREYNYLHEALKIGEKSGNKKIIGYASSWLAYSATELGLIDEAVHSAERACQISETMKNDEFLYYSSHGGAGFANWIKGDRKAIDKAARELFDYGEKTSSSRIQVIGLVNKGLSYLVDGDYETAIQYFQEGLDKAKDPFHSHYLRMWLGVAFAYNDQLAKAEKPLGEVIEYDKRFGVEVIGNVAEIIMGSFEAEKGNLKKGVKSIKKLHSYLNSHDARMRTGTSSYGLGKIYFEISKRSTPISFSFLINNFFFLLANAPFARKRAEQYFSQALFNCKELGSNSYAGLFSLELGLLYKQKGRMEKAEESLMEAIRYFEKCNIKTNLKKAEEALASLEK